MEEMQYLMNFNSSICQAAAKTMEPLLEFVFLSMGNLTFARRDAYLTHIKTGVKPDTLAGLRTAPIHIATLFPDHLIKKPEEEIVHFESKVQSSSAKGKGRYHPYERPDRKADRKSSFKHDKQASLEEHRQGSTQEELRENSTLLLTTRQGPAVL